MADIGFPGLLLVIANVFVSYNGFKQVDFFDNYKFEIDRILINKEYRRLITSGFLHVNWMHLIFNMLSLWAFSGIIEHEIGELNFITIFFASLIGGNLLALYVHRQHGDYSAVGASGAVSGIIFASIALFPGIGIGFFGLPKSIPGWLFGLIFVLYSIYGIKSKRDNIGHEAHLGGALIGMVTSLVMFPHAIKENYLSILCLTVPALIFITLIILKPNVLHLNSMFFNKSKYYSVDERYNEHKTTSQKDIDLILDKIHRKGYDSLSKKEKEKLKSFSTMK